MFIPNKTYTVARNVKDYLSQGKIGNVVNSKSVAKDIGEPEAACSGALWTFHDEGKLELSYKKGNLHYYKVLSNITEPRPGDDRKRAKPFTKSSKMRSEVNGYDFKIESGIPVPDSTGGRHRMYPLPAMKKGDSFMFPIEKKDSVKAACRRFSKANSGIDFTIKKVGTKSARCWRIK